MTYFSEIFCHANCPLLAGYNIKINGCAAEATMIVSCKYTPFILFSITVLWEQ